MQDQTDEANLNQYDYTSPPKKSPKQRGSPKSAIDDSDISRQDVEQACNISNIEIQYRAVSSRSKKFNNGMQGLQGGQGTHSPHINDFDIISVDELQNNCLPWSQSR